MQRANSLEKTLIPGKTEGRIYVLKSCSSISCFINSKWYLPFMKAEEFKSHNLPLSLFSFSQFVLLHFHLFFLLKKKKGRV